MKIFARERKREERRGERGENERWNGRRTSIDPISIQLMTTGVSAAYSQIHMCSFPPRSLSFSPVGRCNEKR